MWRSLLSRLGLAGTVRSPTSAKDGALDTIINSTKTVGTSATRAAIASTDKQTAAHAALRDAVRELSEGNATTISPPPRETMIALSGEDPQNLQVDELCALASATFQGVPDIIAVDPTKAIELWRLAANSGSLDATYSLAVCLRDGKGTTKDPATAYTMLAKLANEHNYNIAHYAAAIMLMNGEGTNKDETTAFQHFKSAAKGGILPALHNVANFYADGRGGVKQSDHNALLYYQAAVDAGDPSAKFTVGIWAAQGRGMPKDITKSFVLQQEAAQAGHPAAMFNVGVMYMSGEGTSRDYSFAVQWYEKASERGIIQASINLGNMYRTGLGVEKNLSKARTYFAMYAEKDAVSKELLTIIDKEITSAS